MRKRGLIVRKGKVVEPLADPRISYLNWVATSKYHWKWLICWKALLVLTPSLSALFRRRRRHLKSADVSNSGSHGNSVDDQTLSFKLVSVSPVQRGLSASWSEHCTQDEMRVMISYSHLLLAILGNKDATQLDWEKAKQFGLKSVVT